MGTSYLRLRFDDDGDGSGKLTARAEANGFSGESGAYFAKSRLKTFAQELSAFPIAGRPGIAGGFWDKAVPGRLEQELLAIECYPVGNRGVLGLRVRLATELWPPSRSESQHVVALEIHTTYESLRHFSRAFLMMVGGDAKEALLEGE